MKPVLVWAKSNPLSTSAAMAALVSLAWLFFVHADGVAFTKQIGQRSRVISQIEALQRTQVRVPPDQPDEPERHLQVAVNQAAIDQLKRVYTQLNREYREIFKLAVKRNQGNHVPMLEGLFPEPLDAAMPFEARRRYRSLMADMVSGRSKHPGYPRLNAGPRPSRAKIREILEQVETNFLASMLIPKQRVGDLTGAEAQQLDRIQADELYTLLEQQARSIHVYAEDQIASPDFPLDVGQWSEPGLRPLMSDIWEGQLGLWIQQDIVEVIARCNHVDDPQSNVINAPVKRLIGIRVLPAYAGLSGGVDDAAASNARGRAIGILAPGTTAAGLSGSGDAEAQVPDDFTFSPTGRRSNVMYDVRHARVSLVIDSRMMPLFFDHLHRVNFMTVLKIDMKDVDEYDALRQGYVYGAGDVVQADMLIETIWLRDWTAALMPELARSQIATHKQ